MSVGLFEEVNKDVSETSVPTSCVLCSVHRIANTISSDTVASDSRCSGMEQINVSPVEEVESDDEAVYDIGYEASGSSSTNIFGGVGADNRNCDSGCPSCELGVVGVLLDKEEDFLTSCCDFKTVLKTRPSKFKSDSEVGWIYLPRPAKYVNYEFSKDVDGLKTEWKWHLENDTPVNFPLVRDLAVKYQVLCGKWMIFCKHGPHIDVTWNLIAQSHHQGKLGICTKVSTIAEDHTHHVICVYNNNFTDKKDVFELEGKLRSVGIRCTMRYKPDVFTYCVIYRLNKWEMKSFIYTSRFDVKTKKSVIVKEYDVPYGGNDSANNSGGEDGDVGDGGSGNGDRPTGCD